MPHNIYLHSALVQSRAIDRRVVAKVKEANFYNAIESSIALFVSLIINLFVVSIFAKTVYIDKVYNSTDIGLPIAGDILETAYGKAAYYIWAVGLLAAGQSSTMTGTYTGQFVMEGFMKWRVKPWIRVLITRSISIIPSVLVAIIAEKYLDTLDELLNVLQSIQLPFALIPVLILTSSTEIMKDFKINIVLIVVCTIFSCVVIASNFYLVFLNVVNFWNDGSDDQEMRIVIIVIVCILGYFYSLFLIYLAIGPFRLRKFFNKNRKTIDTKDKENRKIIDDMTINAIKEGEKNTSERKIISYDEPNNEEEKSVYLEDDY